MSIEAMKLALEALELFVKYENPNSRIQIRKPKDGGPIVTIYPKRIAQEAATALRKAVEQAEQAQPVAWCPDVCPITGLPFFMWIEHHETGQMVPTYGGPYDSYTIPVRDRDGNYCRERYDHDLGGWLADEIEDVGIQIVSDQAYVNDEAPPQRQPLPPQSPCEMTPAERKMFRLGWLECEAAHNIGAINGMA